MGPLPLWPPPKSPKASSAHARAIRPKLSFHRVGSKKRFLHRKRTDQPGPPCRISPTRPANPSLPPSSTWSPLRSPINLRKDCWGVIHPPQTSIGGNSLGKIATNGVVILRAHSPRSLRSSGANPYTEHKTTPPPSLCSTAKSTAESNLSQHSEG